MPGQLVFVHNTLFVADLESIRRHLQLRIDKKYLKYKLHNYIVCEKVCAQLKIEQIRGSIQRTLPDYKGLNKRNCCHALGRLKIDHKC